MYNNKHVNDINDIRVAMSEYKTLWLIVVSITWAFVIYGCYKTVFQTALCPYCHGEGEIDFTPESVTEECAHCEDGLISKRKLIEIKEGQLKENE